MNPYTPPNADVSDPKRAPGSAGKAIGLGLLVDLGGTTLASTLFGFFYAVVLASRGVQAEELPAAMEAAMLTGWGFTLSAIVGCSFSVLGGYVCARIALREDYKFGFIMGGISACFGLVVGWSSYSPIQNALLAGVTLACVLLGTKYGMPKSAG